MINNEIFNKREGTTDKGDGYENLLAAFLAFKLSNDKQVKKFRLSANDELFGKFDDIIIGIEYHKKEKSNKNYIIQMKHTKRNIIKSRLGAEKGDFSIQTYFQSWTELKEENKLKKGSRCILYTNAKYQVLEGCKFKLEGTNCSVKAYKISLKKDFLHTSEDDFAYKFKLEDSDERDKRAWQYKDFFNCFFLYQNQKDVDTLNTYLREKFIETYSCKENAFSLYVEFITNWCKREGKKKSLAKDTIKIKLGEILLRPYLNSSSTCTDKFDLKLFLQTCILYDITIIKSDLNFGVFNKECKQFETGSIIEREYQINSETEENETIKLWHKNKVPLIIRLDESNKETIYKALRLFDERNPQRKFLFIAGNIDRGKFENFKVMQNLEDLDCSPNLFDKISKKEIMIQGRGVTLENIIKEEISKVIMTDELFNERTLQIGEDKEDLPTPYIDQTVSKIGINFDFINDPIIHSLVIIINCKNQLDSIKQNIRNARIVSLEKFLQEDDEQEAQMFYNKTVILAEEKCTAEQFDNICEKSKKICYLLAADNTNNLELIRYNRITLETTKYLQQKEMTESKLCEETNSINIISAQPGAGKSVMLTYLKNNISADYWVIKVNFREHVLFLRNKCKTGENILQHLLNIQSKEENYDAVTLQVRQVFEKKKKIIFLWDGIDEVPQVYLEHAVANILALSNLGFTNWITSRQFLQQFLENRFKIFSFTIKEMDFQQQENYIRKQLGQKHTLEELSGIIEKIISVISMTKDIAFLAVPLRIYMLTDLFLKNPHKYKELLKSSITLPDIIRHFVEEKFKFCYKDKAKISDEDLRGRILNGNTKYRLQQYEIIALKTFLPEEVFENLSINCDDYLEDIDESKNDFGLIMQVDVLTKKGIFVHNTYGEYFVATWMIKNLQHVKNFANFLFEERYKNIRIMFDLMLAQNCPAHIAVLHRDLKNLLKFKDHIHGKDKVGRNPLHLACSWGQPHPLLEPKTEKGSDVYILQSCWKAKLVKDDNVNKDIIKYIIDIAKIDAHEADELFYWSSIQYADYSLSLTIIEELLGNFSFSLEHLQNFSDLFSVLFYCIRFNYENVFKNIKKIEYVVDAQSGYNLLHFAVIFERNRLLESLLASTAYRKRINERSCEKEYVHDHFLNKNVIVEIKESPLHKAAVTGNDEALCKLIDNGATIDKPSSTGSTALHLAIRFGNSSTAALLIGRGANKNLREKENNNAFDLSVLTNQSNIFNLLKSTSSSQCFMDSTSIYIAANQGFHEILECLIKHEIDLNFCDKFKYNLLHSAASYYQCNVAEILINNGADVNSKNNKGWSPLHFAAVYGTKDIIQLLFKKGARKGIKNLAGETPLHLAALYQNKEAFEFLLRNGENINSTDVRGLKPLALLKSNNFEPLDGLFQTEIRFLVTKRFKIYF